MSKQNQCAMHKVHICMYTVHQKAVDNKQAVGGRPPWYAPSPRSAFRRRADGNVAAVSHGQHVLTPTAAAA